MGLKLDLFVKIVDNKDATVWVAKIKDTNQVIGGYNPIDWSGNGWMDTADSFIFNITDERDTSTAKLGYVDNKTKAVWCSSGYEP